MFIYYFVILQNYIGFYRNIYYIVEQLFLTKEYIVPQSVMVIMANMTNEIIIDGVVIGYILDKKMADTCRAFSSQGCSYYDGQCPYCGNTVECQRREEWVAE
jgi:hypothetical protein